MIFVAKKNGRTKKFPPPLLVMLDTGSEIRDPGWIKIRIRNKHPGSATLARLFGNRSGLPLNRVVPIGQCIRLLIPYRKLSARVSDVGLLMGEEFSPTDYVRY
jgi:hypothetical protein